MISQLRNCRPNSTTPIRFTETRTYTGLTGTQAFDGYEGLRIDTHYTGVPQDMVSCWWPNGQRGHVKQIGVEKWFKK